MSELITVTNVSYFSSINYQLVGYATLYSYLKFIKSITYHNFLDEPTIGTRIVSVQAINTEEGMPEMYSNIAYTVIDLINVNDNPPIFSLNKYISESVFSFPSYYFKVVSILIRNYVILYLIF